MNKRNAGLGGPGRRQLRSLILAALLPLCLLSFSNVAGCGEHTPSLQDLNGVEELKARFNKDRGKPRVVLLLSPT
jgi:hypothetical protein